MTKTDSFSSTQLPGPAGDIPAQSGATVAVQPAKPYLVIEPRSGLSALHLVELWQCRDLLLTLAARDVKLHGRIRSANAHIPAAKYSEQLACAGYFKQVLAGYGRG